MKNYEEKLKETKEFIKEVFEEVKKINPDINLSLKITNDDFVASMRIKYNTLVLVSTHNYLTNYDDENKMKYEIIEDMIRIVYKSVQDIENWIDVKHHKFDFMHQINRKIIEYIIKNKIELENKFNVKIPSYDILNDRLKDLDNKGKQFDYLKDNKEIYYINLFEEFYSKITSDILYIDTESKEVSNNIKDIFKMANSITVDYSYISNDLTNTLIIKQDGKYNEDMNCISFIGEDIYNSKYNIYTFIPSSHFKITIFIQENNNIKMQIIPYNKLHIMCEI